MSDPKPYAAQPPQGAHSETTGADAGDLSALSRTATAQRASMDCEDADHSGAPIVRRHTPGPWLLDRIVGGFGYRVAINGDATFAIATVHALPVDGETMRANAQLIAAAPDLLDVCANLVEWWRNGGGSVHTLSEHIAAAEAAVIRATQN